jgi:hypothetical protein
MKPTYLTPNVSEYLSESGYRKAKLIRWYVGLYALKLYHLDATREVWVQTREDATGFFQTQTGSKRKMAALAEEFTR